MAAFQSAFFAAVGGLLVRPCCVIPTALSLVGVSSAGVSVVVMAYRPVFLASSIACLGVSGWLTFRRGGSVLTKSVTILSSAVAFFLMTEFTGVLDVF